MTDPSRHAGGSTVVGAVVALLGIAFLASHVRHVLLMEGLVPRVVQAGIPLVLAATVVWVGVVVGRGDLVGAEDAERFLGWVTVGVLSLLLVVVWVLHHQLTMGHLPHHWLPISVNAATVGALFGIAVGLYDGQRRQSQRTLAQQNERLDQFASVVAHDLRNPLTVAKGRLELVREERDDEDVDAAIEALVRMNQIIEDVLALARFGDESVETEPVDLGSVVRAAWGTVGAETATLEVGGDLPRIEGDATRIQQLLENLFRNAVDHGSLDVTVRVGATSDGFFVEDDGPGISETDRDKVFDSGYSTGSSTGLGLAIIKTIVEAHGWAVTISSSDGGGTRFEFGDVVFE